jgi:pimeloyl-ACP methyl ester carboxylesterase
MSTGPRLTGTALERERFVFASGSAEIAVHRFRLSQRHPTRNLASTPVLVIPGYGMNSRIFSFHPQGTSLVQTLAEAGLDPWTVDMRGQGVGRGNRDAYGIAELAWEDLPRAVEQVLRVTKSAKIDIIGCSLGAAITFTYLARFQKSAPIGKVVSMAGLVTWVDIHPLLRAAAISPRLAALVPVRGVRSTAKIALPLLARYSPALLALYLHTKTSDLSCRDEMLKTVENPTPALNREIAEWIHRRELIVGGVNVSRSLGAMTLPFLCVIARQDGIVPEGTARALYSAVGSTKRELLEVGTDDNPVAHADLFVGRGMREQAFQPVAHFLSDRGLSFGAAVSSS